MSYKEKPNLQDSFDYVEAFYRRAKCLLSLPPDKFVGTNNIRSFLQDLLSKQELGDLCLSSLERHSEAMEVIRLLKKGPESDNCWCEVAINNPMYKTHTEACKRARKLWRLEK